MAQWGGTSGQTAYARADVFGSTRVRRWTAEGGRLHMYRYANYLRHMKLTAHFDDPVAAYDRVAEVYSDLCLRRNAYLRSVERAILGRIASGSRSLLDVGAGDGVRAARIAEAAGIQRVVLVEPSRGMASHAAAGGAEVWAVRAESLRPELIPERFDAITCLWNVLGHVPNEEKRLCALRAVSHLLSATGRLFLDVNYRYNVRSYGWVRTGMRWVRDLVSPDERNGDVKARWTVNGNSVSTYGHVFTHREVMRLARSAGLDLEERVVIDYENGKECGLACSGNLLYVFRRRSEIDSFSAPQTS